jgi:hypothetical protein
VRALILGIVQNRRLRTITLLMTLFCKISAGLLSESGILAGGVVAAVDYRPA